MQDYNGENILIGLSGGINSAAVLCWLIESGIQPKELHLYYAHFKEHSPDTFPFVKALIRYARGHFKCVKVKVTRNSVIDYFRQQKMIPHPTASPCTRKLKIEPIVTYAFRNQIKIDLVGYVKHELVRRSSKQQANLQQDLFSLQKHYPIGAFSDEWCFEIVKKHIGFYPAIYDIRDSKGRRIFKHNNCLPCKNMYPEDIEMVKIYFPWHYLQAIKLSSDLTSYWGRDEAEFYSTFGKDLGQDTTCEQCKW